MRHIDKASEKKRNICGFNKLGVFFIHIYIYIYIYIYNEIKIQQNRKSKCNRTRTWLLIY